MNVITKINLTALFICIFCFFAKSQVAATCAEDTIFFNTGYNSNTNNLQNPLSSDLNWHVTNTPPSFLSPPFLAKVLGPPMSWSNFSNANWIISDFIEADTSYSLLFPFVFERSFCIDADFSTIDFNIKLLSFGRASIELVKIEDETTAIASTNNFALTDPQSTVTNLNNSILLDEGRYKLIVKVFKKSLTEPFGFSLAGLATGSGLVTDACCTANDICDADIFFNNTNFESSFYNAADAIFAKGFIGINDSVRFTAGDLVEMNANFFVTDNALFEANINPCDTFGFVDFCDLPAPQNFEILEIVQGNIILTWQDVPYAPGYIVKYFVDNTMFLTDFGTANNFISIPIAPGFLSHSFTIFTECNPQVGNPQGETLIIQAPDPFAFNNMDCDPPSNLTAQINNGLLTIDWDQAINALSYNLEILANGQQLVFDNNILYPEYELDLNPAFPDLNNIEFTILASVNCGNGEISTIAAEIVVSIIDLPDSIEKVCENRTQENIFMECYGVFDGAKINCTHYKNITKSEFISCHCEEKSVKPKKILPPSCP